jgi:hypothetical protein
MPAPSRDQLTDANPLSIPYAEEEAAGGKLCGTAQLLAMHLRNGIFRPKADARDFIVQPRVNLFVAIKANINDQPCLGKD